MEKFVPSVKDVKANEAKARAPKVKSEKEKYFDRERLGKVKLTQKELSFANEIRKIVTKYGNRPNVQAMLDEVFAVLDNPELHIADKTRNYWRHTFSQIPPKPSSVSRLLQTMTNIMMKGDGLGL